MRRQISGDKYIKTIIRVGSFISAAQYVIFLIIAFTIAWIPYIFMLYSDIINDHLHTNVPDELCQAHGQTNTSSIARLESYSPAQLKVQQVLYLGDVVDEAVKFPFKCEANIRPTCILVQQALHSYSQDNRQLTSILISVVHSILNPIIYAFWYPHFRQQLGSLLRLFSNNI